MPGHWPMCAVSVWCHSNNVIIIINEHQIAKWMRSPVACYIKTIKNDFGLHKTWVPRSPPPPYRRAADAVFAVVSEFNANDVIKVVHEIGIGCTLVGGFLSAPLVCERINFIESMNKVSSSPNIKSSTEWLRFPLSLSLSIARWWNSSGAHPPPKQVNAANIILHRCARCIKWNACANVIYSNRSFIRGRFFALRSPLAAADYGHEIWLRQRSESDFPSPTSFGSGFWIIAFCAVAMLQLHQFNEQH